MGKRTLRSIVTWSLVGLICNLLFIRLTCDESLPARLEPANVYIVSLQIIAPYPDRIRRDMGQVEVGKGNLGFNVSVINVFDETLTDTVQYRFGQIEIWWTDQPDVMKTIPITIRDELETNEIGFWGDIIFDPGDSIYVVTIWPFLMDDEYPPMEFEAQAKVQLFEQTAMVYSDIVRFRVYFYE